MPWNDAVLSTTESIAKINRNINNISSTDEWTEKIELAKKDIGKRLQVAMKKDGFDTNLDNVLNPEIFGIASDYRVLYLIYRDLSANSEVAYSHLVEQYEHDYIEEMKVVENLYEININGSEIDGSKSKPLINCVR